MADHNNKAEPTLHGNRAKIDPSCETAFFCHRYEQKTEPSKFGFESLPGSKADLKKARDEYKGEKRVDDLSGKGQP